MESYQDQQVSKVFAAIDGAIRRIEERLQQLRSELPEGAEGGTRGASAAEMVHQIENMELLIARLRQIKDLLKQDSRLLPLVDGYIGQQVHAMEQRQARFNVALAVLTTLIGVVLGWLLSAVTPVSIVVPLLK